MTDKYILNDAGEPVPCDNVLEWALFFEDGDARRVVKTEVGPYSVSTVFLALDHSFGYGPPILYETLVFGRKEPGADDAECIGECYGTRAEAEAGHAVVVEKVKQIVGAEPCASSA